jgi:uncharacterized protein YndB with AHSA1/START domain
MTGGQPARISAEPGAKFTAWNEYISGTSLELVPGKLIVQSWRTAKLSVRDADSKITLTLAPAAGGTRVTVAHTNVPDGHTSYRDGGWQNNYFAPTKKYFRDQIRGQTTDDRRDERR